MCKNSEDDEMSIKINKKNVVAFIIDFVMINFGALVAAAAIFFNF